MDFFQAQDDARRNTKKLVFLYALAVIGLIVSVYVVLLFLFAGAGTGMGALWVPELFFTVSVVILLVITAGSGWRISQLRKGGRAVAEMMGARLVSSNTQDQHERKLLNIVEEMSIASGVPVPGVYVMDGEKGINAFAAGYGTRDAVVGVTRGCMELLNRDELQGVIAHEFSHIFNGDMRLNIRLIGILNGILIIHLMGMILMRSQMYARIGGGRNKNNAGLAIIALGLALTVIGYLGVLFGRMIQSAVSRQREFLADAAAAQFTRNPEGIASALAKIQRHAEGSDVKDAHAAEMSHLFFSTGQKSWMNAVFATHPPIKKRIEALNALHVLEAETGSASRRKQAASDQQSKQAAGKSRGPLKGHDALNLPAITPEVLVAAAGTLEATQLEQARQLREALPDTALTATQNTDGAVQLVYALLMDKTPAVRGRQLEILSTGKADDISEEVLTLADELQDLSGTRKMALVEMAIPALRELDKKEYRLFRSRADELIKADGRQLVFEFALRQVLVHSLDAHFGVRPEAEIRHTRLDSLIPGLSVVLSALSHASGGGVEESFKAAMGELSRLQAEGHAAAGTEELAVRLVAPEACTGASLEQALEELSASSGEVRRIILDLAAHAVCADSEVNEREMLLIRAVAAALDIPLPLIG
ncbi:Zn-dependent protease with chaperone function [Cyclonatronum proteinivorum]|uniref:Zn-dependent protease with chaperone function n=1 Tax=Cyclonatronum proteinivorum TaxID=1457365 RepID=A0A345UMW2_9BACT|nr:M48 family metallopeptidase [Cyclonatronum proteinivorum]AXJ01814.1 Zn-dependent protease with chaperone function [Cyclonatronum proteinivorum]